MRAQQLVNKAKAALAKEIGPDPEGVRLKGHMEFVAKTALDSFMKGLKPDLELRVAIRRPQTLDSAIEVAREEARVLAERYHGASFPPHFVRPFNNASIRGYPVPGPRQPSANPQRPTYSPNPERFAPKPQAVFPASRPNEMNRPFLTPRQPPLHRGHFQPPIPRYADREVTAYATCAHPEYYSEFQNHQDFYSPYINHQNDYMPQQQYYDPYDHSAYGAYEGAHYASPGPQVSSNYAQYPDSGWQAGNSFAISQGQL